MHYSAIVGARRARPGLSAPFGNWLICWVLLPNLPFCAMWLVGGPPRLLEIFVTGFVGLVVRRAPAWVRMPVWLLLLAASCMNFVSGLFRLSILSMFYSLRFVLELKPAASPEYALVGAGLLIILLLSWRFMRRSQDFAAPRELFAAGGLLLALCTIDYAATAANKGSYKASAPVGAPFSSAVKQARFAELSSRGNHLVIVMVEAMGLPTDPRLQSLLLRRWREGRVASRYDMETGSTPFFGSTTTGEMRELCGRWEDYHDLREKQDNSCLPAQLARRGYATSAVHGFDHSFFERTQWYPNIGFQRHLFREQLLADGKSRCGGVFPGACDRDIPSVIGAQLKRADKPQFIYWLTLNTHIPVPESSQLGTKDCERFDPVLARDHAMLCRLFSMWDGMNAELAKVLADPDLPPTDILIVGDHAPPFFDRSQREQFDMARVPWILLKSKRRASALE